MFVAHSTLSDESIHLFIHFLFLFHRRMRLLSHTLLIPSSSAARGSNACARSIHPYIQIWRFTLLIPSHNDAKSVRSRARATRSRLSLKTSQVLDADH